MPHGSAPGGAYPPDGGACWTDGELTLPAALFAHLRGGFRLIVHTGRHTLRYPLAAAAASVGQALSSQKVSNRTTS